MQIENVGHRRQQLCGFEAGAPAGLPLLTDHGGHNGACRLHTTCATRPREKSGHRCAQRSGNSPAFDALERIDMRVLRQVRQRLGPPPGEVMQQTFDLLGQAQMRMAREAHSVHARVRRVMNQLSDGGMGADRATLQAGLTRRGSCSGVPFSI